MEMKESFDPLLKRLDVWAYNRYERNYTDEVSRKVRVEAEKIMRQDRELSDLVSEGFLDFLSRRNILKQASTAYSLDYNSFDQFLNGEGEGTASRLSPAIMDEYVTPFSLVFNRCKSTVEKLRRCDVNRLSDKDIDRVALESFENIENYIDFCNQLGKTMAVFSQVAYPEMDFEEKRGFDKGLKLMAQVNTFIVREVYSDLFGQGDKK